MNANDALDRLIKGNQNFISGAASEGDVSSARLRKLASQGQEPFATIISCSDSRVPPEHLFSVGLGDVFVVRTAGNVVGPYEVGSVEYAVEHLGTKLVVVMGHTHCGAVKAALAEDDPEGSVMAIVRTIRNLIFEDETSCSGETLADRNIKNSLSLILESPVIQRQAEQGDVQVVAAKYDIETGIVTFEDK